MLTPTQPRSLNSLVPFGVLVVEWQDMTSDDVRVTEVDVPSGYARDHVSLARTIIEAHHGPVIYRSFTWHTD